MEGRLTRPWPQAPAPKVGTSDFHQQALMPEGITPEELLERLQALPDPAAGEAAKNEAAQEKTQ